MVKTPVLQDNHQHPPADTNTMPEDSLNPIQKYVRVNKTYKVLMAPEMKAHIA